MTTTRKGQEGEKIASVYLENQGYTPLVRNYRSHRGEIDLIFLGKEHLLFVEVKTWSSNGMQDLAHSITNRKKLHLLYTAKRYLLEHPELEKLQPRFDIVFVQPESGTVEHIKNAFTE